MQTDIECLERIRPRLMGLAYRMLGSVAEAEDVVQDVAVRYLGLDTSEVRAPEQYLTSMTARACVDHLRSARHRREVYVGPWLPEPIRTFGPGSDIDDVLEQEESISMAFLVIMQRLSALERAAFLLHDVFDFEYGEIGRVLDRSEEACRQLVSRARSHVRAGRPRFDVPRASEQRLAERFLQAARSGDVDDMVSILAEEATVWVDGGGKVSAAPLPVTGADRVARYFTGIFRKAPRLTSTIEVFNGLPAVVLRHRRGIDSVISFDVRDGRIHGVFNQRNPDKLERL